MISIPPHIVLETERLVLRTIDESFAQRCLDYYERNREFLAPWNPTPSPDFYTLEFQRLKLNFDTELRAQDRAVRFWLFRKDDLQQEYILGGFAFSNIVRGAFQSCHLGYYMDGAAINQGYITEALRRGITFAFDELLLHRIEANVMPRNVRSRRVLEKLGFEYEGLSRRYLKIAGVWEDHIHYVMLNPREDI
jgi:ribosomal-protein-alanine N-acetyltransferase